MRYILVLLMLPSLVFASSITTTGKAVRILNRTSECGGWGHTGLVMEAKQKAQESAAKICGQRTAWGAMQGQVILINDDQVTTDCGVHSYSGVDVEVVTVNAIYDCDYSHASTNNNTCRGRLWCYEG